MKETGMIFIVFHLSGIHRQVGPSASIGYRMVEAEDIEDAKRFMTEHYKGAWAIISEKTFKEGIVHGQLKEAAPWPGYGEE
jgi:hypothetical protein